MLGLALAAAVGARNVSFANYGDGYLEVVAEGVSCPRNDLFRLQRSEDSAAVAGTARPEKHRRVDEYGVFASHDEVVHDSGLFVPEFNTGAGVERLVSEMWADWADGGDTSNVYSYKYAPTGMAFARPSSLVDANEQLMPFLSKLPLGDLAIGYNYTNYDVHTREPWNAGNGHSAFPGMLPALHPVLDPNPNPTAESEEIFSLQKRYAVRTCPGSDSRCCLAVENGEAGEAANPLPFSSFARTRLDTDDAVTEWKLRWRGRAFHTSYSRGLPDLNTYTQDQKSTDFLRHHGDDPNNNVMDALRESLAAVQTATGDARDPSNGENELKCRKTSNVGEKSYWAAARLEHFYTAVVGIEEAGMLRQKPPEYDGDRRGENLKREATGSNTIDASGELAQNAYVYNFEDDHDCSAQPGGHCGFGYRCKDLYTDAVEKYLAEGGAESLFPFRGYCHEGRWRGRPELLRFAGDGVSPAVPFDNYTTLSHVLDGEGDDWYNEEFRMSARLVYTGPDESDPSEQGANELPCATTRRDGAYKNVAGDFTRACGKLRATSYEWLLTAFIQTHKYPYPDDLHRGANDDGFWWESERGIGPRPCSSTIKRDKCYLNNRFNRVRLWDIDSSWSLNANDFNYGGAPENSDYYKNLKALHEIDNVDLKILHYGPSTDNTRWSMPSAAETTSHGTSDGTSRTNIHSAACHLPSKVSKASAENDRGAKFNAGCVGCANWDNYYAARATFWPYQWGTMRAINADVDWTSPAGCDYSYGPPCTYADAIVDKYHASSRQFDWYRGTYHKQGAPGVFGCTEYKDNGGATRADWDGFRPDVFSSKLRRAYPTGDHTCSNLMNATHFRLEDLDIEEWDMRAYHRHGWGKRNCAYDDGAAIQCTIAAISLNCHGGVSPIDNDHHTLVYQNPSAGDDGPEMAAKFVNVHRRILATADKELVYSPNWSYENDDSVWVNWGKQIVDKQNGAAEGDNLAEAHSPYKHGKDDGIVECLRPRDDLLLHSLMKRTWKCTLTEEEALLKTLSPCANPKDYHEWRAGLEKGFFKMDVNSVDDEAPKKASGRHYPTDRYHHPCECLETGGAVRSCNCGLLARTSRLVVGPERDAAIFTDPKPYAPEWVRTESDGVGGSVKHWCKAASGDSENLGFVPRRACPRANLFSTNFWAGSHTFSEDEVPDVLKKEATETPFVRRPNAIFSRAELMQMRACVNVEGTDFCETDIADLRAAPTVTLESVAGDESRRAVVIRRPDDSNADCAAHFETLKGPDSPLEGLTAAEIGVDLDNRLTETNNQRLCKVVPDGSQADNPPFLAWNLDFDADFTLAKDTVAVGLGMYEMTKLRQCLLGDGECPTVSSSKTLRLTIPVSECPEDKAPRIMYRCYEDNDPDAAVTEGTEVLDTMNFNSVVAKKYGVRGFQHIMRNECMDKIQFAIECDGKQELHELDNSVCAASGFSENCQANVNYNVLRYDMCVKPYEYPQSPSGSIGTPQFFITPPEDVVPYVLTDGAQTCDCSKSLLQLAQIVVSRDALLDKSSDQCYIKIVSGREGSGAVLFEDADSTVPDGYEALPLNFNASVCAPTFREIDLHDYRENIPMHVYWKHCSALQLHFTLGSEQQYSDAYENTAFIAVSDAIGIPGGASIFFAELAIPLSFEDRLEGESGSIMWGHDEALSVRELVPGPCRGTQDVLVDGSATSRIFTRDVPFDFEPGEPFSKISLGVCNNNPDVNICARDDEGPIFFNNLLPNGFSGGLTNPIATRLVSAKSCFEQCKVTVGCQTFAFSLVDGQERCNLYADVPKLVRLLTADRDGRFVANLKIDGALGNGAEGFGTCIDAVPLQLSALRPPSPPPPRCPSGQTLVPIDVDSDDREQKLVCVRSACDPVTEVAVPIFSDYDCDGECEQLCTGVHETLTTYSTLKPALWTVATPPADAVVSYEYADTLPLAYQPKFVFVVPGSGRTLLTDVARRLARFKFTLPPVKLGNCNPCVDADGNANDRCHLTDTQPELTGAEVQAHIDNGLDTVDRSGENVPRLGLASRPLAVGTLRLEFFGESDDGEALYTTEIEGHVLVQGQGGGSKTVQSINVDPIREDVLVQEYAYLTLVVTVVMDEAASKLSGSQYALEYNMNGPGCACDEHHPGRVVQAAAAADDGGGSDDALETNVDFRRRRDDAPVPPPTSLETCIQRDANDADAVDPAAISLPTAEIKVCTAPREAPEVCIPRTKCNADAEYVADEGSLERDRSCARHPVCLDSEYAHRPATVSTARECRALVECTDFEEVITAGNAVRNFECKSLGRCGGANEYRNTTTKLCATKTDCALKNQREVQQLSDFADAVCTEYEVVCDDVQYTETERTLTDEASCKSYTICEATEFSLRDATVSSDRACKPLQKCKSREIYRAPDSFEEDAVCTPIVRFSFGWITASLIAGAYLATLFAHMLDKYFHFGRWYKG